MSDDRKMTGYKLIRSVKELVHGEREGGEGGGGGGGGQRERETDRQTDRQT